MKRKCIIIAVLFLVIMLFSQIHGEKTVIVEKENSRIKIEYTAGLLTNQRLKGLPKLKKSGVDKQVYENAVVYSVQNNIALFDKYYKKNKGEWVMDEKGVEKEFSREDIIMHSTEDTKLLWALTARLLEACKEIEYRLSKGGNDADELKLYKQLINPIANSKKMKSDVCSDSKKYGNDPLYYLGCGGNSTVRAMLMSTLASLDMKSSDDAAGMDKACGSESRNKFANRFKIYKDDEPDERVLAAYDVIQYANSISPKVEEAITEYNKALEDKSDSDSSNKDTQTVPERDVSSTGSGDWWKDAQSFFGSAKNSGQDAGAANSLVTELSDMIFNVGNMIFIVVTSILGVKYIFGSAEGKAQIKDSLITLIVAALFFYGWSAISNLLDIGGLLASGTFESTAAKIYNTVLFIVNLAAIAGVIWIGVKYMLSSAEGRAEIKTSWGPLILGIIMVYATVWFLSTIISTVLG